MPTRRRQVLQWGAAGWLLAAPPGARGGMPAASGMPDAWPQALFQATSLQQIARGLGLHLRPSDAVRVTGPDIAEIGAAVPVGVECRTPGVDLLGLAVPRNPVALAGLFELEADALPQVDTRIKMARSSHVYGLARSGGTLLYARKLIKVTVGGCG